MPKPRADEAQRIAIEYARAIQAALPLLGPRHLQDLINRISKEPGPAPLIGITPREIETAWYEARTSRERYHALLAEHILTMFPDNARSFSLAPKRGSEFQ